ncbi:hypothetical protein SIM91_05280 [Rhodococcus opacus]|uniref:Uncharacterized protein n=1 Tax=Rhodococcus opacus TaxID=37919 RepID=A0AAX3YRT0_RHOOP|nr:hypothetical protein [Rhodococcus opacus]ELB90781.1 hypothetical protein Rwratislav_22517 [Rhodococcus wratislaviensis IFP 2016]MCZ4589647.1 hypothetical protein [Rhodococcus opacus]MDX5962736.1 hypothetical protein [Rhodococcus opacus]WLF51194.1 hypothetical protein Q5707_38175 [Rhodococcus opacus]CAG7636977.1 hypothetical protein E143388_07848 [Rhodococcus opacus]
MTRAVRIVQQQLPTWRGGNVLCPLNDAGVDFEAYTRFGITFDDEPDEDAVAYLEQVVGYAWPANMTGVPKIDEGRVSVHDTTVVFDADIRLRRHKTRTSEDATRALAANVLTYYAEGSPVRKDGNRLVNRPGNVALPSIVGFVLG